MSKRFICYLTALLAYTTLVSLGSATAAQADESAIAREAFLYGYPIVDGYGILLNQALDSQSSGFQAPMNTISHRRRLATPQDRVIVSPNTDTVMSYAWLDLRTQPLVLSMPPIPSGRYMSVQLIDLTSAFSPRLVGGFHR